MRRVRSASTGSMPSGRSRSAITRPTLGLRALGERPPCRHGRYAGTLENAPQRGAAQVLRPQRLRAQQARQHQQVREHVARQQVDAAHPPRYRSSARARSSRADTGPSRPTPRSAAAAAARSRTASATRRRPARGRSSAGALAPRPARRSPATRRPAGRSTRARRPVRAAARPRPGRGASALARLGRPTRHERQDDGRDHRDAEQRATDPTAATAEAVVDERDEQQHAGGDRQRERDHHRAPAGGRRQRRLEGGHVQPGQQRPGGDDEGGRPGEDAEAEPARPAPRGEVAREARKEEARRQQRPRRQQQPPARARTARRGCSGSCGLSSSTRCASIAAPRAPATSALVSSRRYGMRRMRYAAEDDRGRAGRRARESYALGRVQRRHAGRRDNRRRSAARASSS